MRSRAHYNNKIVVGSLLGLQTAPFCSFVLLSKTEKIIIRYMKKTYVSPLMTEVNVAAETMLAASLKMDNEKTVDTSNGGQLGGSHRGEWGNLWN